MSRDAERWLSEIGSDIVAVKMQLDFARAPEASREQVLRALAVARKEARRLNGDLARYARSVHGIEEGELDSLPV